jgi:hypothetical protein
MVRRGYGDEIWRLAGERDVVGLRRAASLLQTDEEFEYDAHRAEAFARSLEGDVDGALAQLNEGWTGDWPFPAGYAIDVARARYLGGDAEGAVASLALGLRGAERVNGAARELLAACVGVDPGLWRQAVKVALSGGSVWDRGPTSLAVIRARFRPES